MATLFMDFSMDDRLLDVEVDDGPREEFLGAAADMLR